MFDNIRLLEAQNERTQSFYLTEKLSENIISSTSEFTYIPCDFKAGNKYEVTIRFNSFTSTSNRKFSLRTTTAQYASTTYVADIIVIVDKENTGMDGMTEALFSCPAPQVKRFFADLGLYK